MDGHRALADDEVTVTELTIDDYRRLLSDLRADIADRVRAEQELAKFEADEDEPSQYDFGETLQTLADEVERETANADARHESERQRLTQRHQATVKAADAEHGRIVGHVRQRIDAELAAVEQQYAENTWMLSSLLDDDAENSPKRQYEALNDQLQQARDHLGSQWEDLKSRYARAVELLEVRRQRTDAHVEPPVDSRTRKEAHERFEEAEKAVRLGVARLHRQVLPRLFAGGTFVLLGLVLWGGLFAAGYLLVDPQSLGMNSVKPAGHVLLSAGMSFAVTMLLLMALWGIAASQTARVFRPVRQGMADAQTHQQTWFRLAKDELQRSEKQYRDRYETLVERRDRSFERFAAERDEQTAALREERERELSAPALRRDELVRDSAMQLNRELLASEMAHRKETIALRTRFENEQQRLTQERETRRADREARSRELRSEMAGRWAAGLQRLQSAAEDANRESRRRFCDWALLLSDDWQPPETIPHGIRIGGYVLNLDGVPHGVPADRRLAPESTIVRLPAVLPFPDPPSLV
ncbi:MAG: hypothetical protein WBC44_18985, partial [Planctomycetaceae bacterium]